MKRDKILLVFIVIVSCVITGVLQYSKSPETLEIISYLTALESNLCEFAEGDTTEVSSFTSPLKSGTEDDIISIENFVEEQLIIEEFTSEKHVGLTLCRDESTDYISFCLSLTNNMNVNDNPPKVKMNNVKSSDTIFSAALQGINIANSNHSITHKIKANDSLFKLAKRYYNDGSKWTEIYQANKNEMPDPDSLKIGQELLIPNITVSSKEDRIKIIKT